jgi:hypothetical protein
MNDFWRKAFIFGLNGSVLRGEKNQSPTETDPFLPKATESGQITVTFGGKQQNPDK